MATLVLSAAGMALGGSIGGSIAGLSMAVIGRAAGGLLGRAIDQRLLGGGGGETVEQGRVDRFRLTGASEGSPIGQVYGRVRVGGQVIWATRFKETVNSSGGGGKGAPSGPQINEYSYSISIAIAVCEGEITRVGRVWADGVEIAPDDLNMRVYRGSMDQLADPKITAVEGADNTPAFRGTAYVVLEDLELGQFGNRVPQFNFEITRPAADQGETIAQDLSHAVQAVALLPGSGEYTLATTPVYFDDGFGKTRAANINSPSAKSDLETSLDALVDELPKCQSTSLIVSWFGSDLRCGECELRPKVEQNTQDADGMAWTVSGENRSSAEVVVELDGRRAYGGTPADAAVVESIAELHSRGQAVMFYPFILMDQLDGNTLPNPWSDDDGQPAFPWRGRITASKAPGQTGSPDQTAGVVAEIDAFFGTATAADFTVSGHDVAFAGAEWSYSRFILHYAHLCAAAGGVDAFCIGSEMRSLTQLRDDQGNFPFVQHLIALTAEVRSILGPDTKISYAADWSEYFGYQPQDGSNDRYFHLDPLWADDNIDFIGIDNYMPLSDWRDGCEHTDFDQWGDIYNLDYLMSNIEGGEGYDWYYHSPDALEHQVRTPITDPLELEPWIWRYKDIRNWWKNPHYDRSGGVRSLTPTDWAPESKPIWFTEMGCAAVDKGTNEPNKFLDPKSSESTTPRFSNGQRDELIQMQYIRALYSYWGNPAHNPVSQLYEAPMLDMTRAHVWAWDARPFPAFPGQLDVWSDGLNYPKGHWLSGRSSARPLDSVVREICARSGVTDIDVSELFGYVRGYHVGDVGTGRGALQPLMLAYGFDAVERDGKLIFKNRKGKICETVDRDCMVIGPDTETAIQITRQPEAEIADRVRLNYVKADGSFEVGASEAIFPEYETQVISTSEFPLVLTDVEARQMTERWLTESRVARDTARFALPPSKSHLGASDVIAIEEPGGLARFRLDSVEVAGQRLVDAIRIEEEVYKPLPLDDLPVAQSHYVAPTPVFPIFMDLPIMSGDEVPHAPHLAVTADPWPGSAAVYSSSTDANYAFNRLFPVASTLGETLTALPSHPPAIYDLGAPLSVQLTQGSLTSITEAALLAGGNLAAIGDGTSKNWEVFQFEEAVITGPNTFDVSMRLRGQLGTDALMPPLWSAGSVFVLLDSGIKQLNLPSTSLNIEQHYRVGPGNRPYDDPSFLHHVDTFCGVGLRPYSPVWLNAASDGAGGLLFNWVRRARMNADAWDQPEIPLGEAVETYIVEIWQGSNMIRSETVTTQNWHYDASAIGADAIAGSVEFKVAQVSDVFGPGLFASLHLMI